MKRFQPFGWMNLGSCFISATIAAVLVGLFMRSNREHLVARDITLVDEKGAAVIEIGKKAFGTCLLLRASNGQERFTLWLDPNGNPSIDLSGQEGGNAALTIDKNRNVTLEMMSYDPSRDQGRIVLVASSDKTSMELSPSNKAEK